MLIALEGSAEAVGVLLILTANVPASIVCTFTGPIVTSSTGFESFISTLAVTQIEYVSFWRKPFSSNASITRLPEINVAAITLL